MSEKEEIDVQLRIHGRFYEGKVRPKQVGSQVQSEFVKRPIFPEPYSEMLSIADEGTHWYIRPKAFLQTSDFAEITRIVKQYGGSYVSAGKASHFLIPK